MHLFKKFALFSLCFFSSFAIADVSHHFGTIKSDPNALYAFLKTMPKGGELHYHLSGGAYPENMIKVGGNGDYCLDQYTYTVSKRVEGCKDIHLKDIYRHPELYIDTLRAWSMKDFIATESESGHDHFFAIFYKFKPLIADFRPQLLAEVMRRAADNHEQYLEIMVLLDDANAIDFGHIVQQHKTFHGKQKALLKNKAFQTNVARTIHEADRLLDETKEILHCNKHTKEAACEVKVRFQYYLLREQPLNNLFAQALNGFEAASQSPNIVGMNIVQAEDSATALKDYRKQMALLKKMHNAYPNVHIALHAGELSPESVTPEDLSYHIHDAIFTGQAERIGHGVDIAYEKNAKALVQHMAKASIPVEINLTSNQKILNVSGKAHPLNYYLDNNVPVVLSTDDEGILRTDLTREYVKAVTVHGLDYPTLKNISRNALTYSFLPGESLWANAPKATPVSACRTLESASCEAFIKKSEKAQAQWQLEKKLRAFEKQF